MNNESEAKNIAHPARYDLYIVSENVEEDGSDNIEDIDGGHLNASYAASDPDERLRVEITDETVLANNNNNNKIHAPDNNQVDPLPIPNGNMAKEPKLKKKVNFMIEQQSILPSLHSHRGERYKHQEDREPKCFPVFRWGIMSMGVIMLVIVIIILIQLVLEFDTKYKYSRVQPTTTVPTSFSTSIITSTIQTTLSEEIESKKFLQRRLLL